MKNSATVSRPRPESPDNQITPALERPLKICVVFDEADSAERADVLINHVGADYECDTQSFRFDELDPPRAGVTAARDAADTDIMVVAVGDDRMLPAHMQSWFGLWLGLRDEDREGALVVLMAKEMETGGQDIRLLWYMETLATIGRLTFFPRQRHATPQTLRCLPY